MINVLLIILGAKLGYSLIRHYITKPNYIKKNLKKYFTSDNVKVVSLPDELYETIDESKVKDNEVYIKTFEDFGKIIEGIIPREDLDNYYRNFSTLKEKSLSFSDQIKIRATYGGFAGGAYNTLENEVDLKTSVLGDLSGSTNHELLHASSTNYDKENNIIYSGFSQTFIKDTDGKKTLETFGLGINEGYTQYLNIKLFGSNSFLKEKIYEDDQKIAKLLNIIVGEEKMQSYYFRADLKGLVEELEKYNTKEEVYKFINTTDILHTFGKYKNKRISELSEAKQYVQAFLFKSLLKSGKMTAEDLSRLCINGDVPYGLEPMNLDKNSSNTTSQNDESENEEKVHKSM